MTDENALIEALQANPADDDLRLIYADWLEEHGDVRADYFRLVAELTACPADNEAYDELKARLIDLTENISREWREAVGKRFSLLLVSFLDRKIGTIKNVRAVTRWGLKDSKEFVESPLPAVVRDSLLREDAEQLLWELEFGYTLLMTGEQRPNEDRSCTAAIIERGQPLSAVRKGK